jgi:hypothetical protein
MIDIKELYLRGNVIFDTKFHKGFFIYKIYSEQKISHCRVIYMSSINDNTKQQFTEDYFIRLVMCGQLIIFNNE